MTNEEAIKWLTSLQIFFKEDSEQYISLDMAIEALKQQEYTEQIRWERDIALEQLKELGYSLGEKPKQWIPCESITEPIDREVLCCDKYGNELIGWLDYNDYYECWVCESDECVMYDTVAYMEKPEPWKGEQNDNLHDDNTRQIRTSSCCR